MSKKKAGFSVGLGLFDYINPIFYAITSITIALNIFGVMNTAVFIIYIIGAVISLIFGMTIPTVKFIVGLGIMEFKMPVNLVFYVNSGIFISGLMLFYTLICQSIPVIIITALIIFALLGLIYYKKKKFNTVAVLIGAFGYIMIYSSLIYYALKNPVISSLVLYIIAICLFVSLCLIGIKGNLKDARVHWVIEISNVICQMCVAVATLLVFN